MVLVVVGVAGSATVGLEWRASIQSQDNQTIDVRVAGARASLAQVLAHDADLAGAVGALATSVPSITNTQFERWFARAGGPSQYEDVVAVVYIQRVPAAGLPAASSKITADPPFGVDLGPFHLTPSGVRQQYCLLTLGLTQLSQSIQSHSAAVLQALLAFAGFLEPGRDQCAAAGGPLLVAAEAAGVAEAGPLSQMVALTGSAQAQAATAVRELFGGLAPYYMALPVYSTPNVPTGAIARQAAVSGWVLEIVDAAPLLTPVVDSMHGLAVTLSYQNSMGTPVRLAQAGRAPASSVTRTVTLGAGGRWIAQITVPSPSALTPDEQGGIVLAGSLLLVILLVFLVQVLAVSRAQALELVTQTAGELEHQAHHDALTGLANRAMVLEELEQALARGRAGHATALALLVIDLDGFKDVNDAFGHSVGDELLQAMAGRLVEMVGVSTTVGRIGGDEFVIVVDGGPVDDPEQLAKSVLSALALPVRLPSVPGTIAAGASIGVATGLRTSARDLLRDADIALYEAKASGRNRYAVFRPEMRAAVVNRFDLEAELRTAMRANQFFLVYQPTFDLEGMGVTGVEALLRWHHPTRGIVPPVEFVPVLESSGMIVEVGRWVLAEACRQVRQWHNQGHAVSVAVNVSGRQFEGSNLVNDVRGALVRSGLDPHKLVVEITETVLMRDPAAIADRLRQLKALGVRIAIDDFGTGYSSMAYLQQFPVDVLKIDRSFVMGMVESAEGAALVRALVQLGKALGLTTLAEGIEDEVQLYRLRAEKCDAGQGFLFAKPLAPSDAMKFMVERRAALADAGAETVSAAGGVPDR